MGPVPDTSGRCLDVVVAGRYVSAHIMFWAC